MTEEQLTCGMVLRLLAAPASKLALVAQVINEKDEALILVLKSGQRFALTVSGPAERRGSVRKGGGDRIAPPAEKAPEQSAGEA